MPQYIVPESDLFDKIFIDTETVKQYTVERIWAVCEKTTEVDSHPNGDWYLKLLTVNSNGSHRIIYWDAIAVKNTSLIREIEKNKKQFILIDK